MSSFKKAFSKRVPSRFACKGDSMTQQNFKAECDINNILRKYQKTGLLEHVQQFQGRYEDLSSPVDYQTALNICIQAQGAFDTLPSSVRKRFSNNPQEFIEFVNNPDNAEEMYALGLAQRPDPIPAQPATIEETPAAE